MEALDTVKMSVQVQVLYGHAYVHCKMLHILTDKANSPNLESLENLVQSIVGDFYNDQKIQRERYTSGMQNNLVQEAIQ